MAINTPTGAMEKSVNKTLKASIAANVPTKIQLNRKKRQAASVSSGVVTDAACMPANWPGTG